jgi:hypothetical protein
MRAGKESAVVAYVVNCALSGAPEAGRGFWEEERFSARKSFGCKILISNSFGCKILRGRIFSAPLF